MKPRSKFRRWAPLIAIVAIPVLACVFYFHEKPFADRKAVLEEVVETIRGMQLKPGEVVEFKMDDLNDAKSLHPVKEGTYFFDGAGLVWARVIPGGSLQVGIMTYDWHHFGHSGFAYSDERMTPEADYDGLPWLDLPGPLDHPNPDKEIDVHWWKVHTFGD